MLTTCFQISSTLLFHMQAYFDHLTILYPNFSLSMALQPFGPWLLFLFLNPIHSWVGLLGWRFSLLQGCYVHREQHKHRINTCLEWDSNPWPQCYIIYHTFVGSDRICFTPGFPVKDPKFGVLASFTHVVAPYLKYCYFPRSFFHFHCIFFSWHNFCLSYKIVFFTEKCPQEHRINCPTVILEESDLP
jgi:hypothetical protein